MNSSEHPLMRSQLPQYPAPSVNLTREQLKRFRDDYHVLGEFAALVCGVDIRDLCRLDLVKWLWNERGIATEWTAVLLALAAEGE